MENLDPIASKSMAAIMASTSKCVSEDEHAGEGPSLDNNMFGKENVENWDDQILLQLLAVAKDQRSISAQ
jgi:hypothetical protein